MGLASDLGLQPSQKKAGLDHARGGAPRNYRYSKLGFGIEPGEYIFRNLVVHLPKAKTRAISAVDRPTDCRTKSKTPASNRPKGRFGLY